jgi:hypothetical protein
MCENSAKFCKQPRGAKFFAIFSFLNGLRPRKSDRRSTAIPFFEDFEQVVTGAGVERLEAEVVENEAIGLRASQLNRLILSSPRTNSSPDARQSSISPLGSLRHDAFPPSTSCLTHAITKALSESEQVVSATPPGAVSGLQVSVTSSPALSPANADVVTHLFSVG